MVLGNQSMWCDGKVATNITCSDPSKEELVISQLPSCRYLSHIYAYVSERQPKTTFFASVFG